MVASKRKMRWGEREPIILCFVKNQEGRSRVDISNELTSILDLSIDGVRAAILGLLRKGCLVTKDNSLYVRFCSPVKGGYYGSFKEKILGLIKEEALEAKQIRERCPELNYTQVAQTLYRLNRTGIIEKVPKEADSKFFVYRLK